jgi:hypothetical protein
MAATRIVATWTTLLCLRGGYENPAFRYLDFIRDREPHSALPALRALLEAWEVSWPSPFSEAESICGKNRSPTLCVLGPSG